MNAELYFITQVGFSEQENKNSMKEIAKLFEDANIDILYETIINPETQKIEQAFADTAKSKENIDVVIMVGGLYNSESCVVKKFFANHGFKLGAIDHADNVEMIYSEDGIVPGYAIKHGEKLVVTIPYLANQTSFIIRKYVAPYIMRNMQPDMYVPRWSGGKHVSYKKTKKHKFLRNIIPYKGDSLSQIIIKILLIIFAGTFIVCSYMLLNILVIEPHRNGKLNESIHNMYVVDNNEDYTEEGILRKFSKLRNINKDIKGWIYIPYTVIDYPVLQSGKDDPTYYLYRDYNKDDNRYGSLFIDANCDLKKSKNIIIHGHNMNDGSMFANLLKYDDIEFYKNSPVITFDTLYEIGKWKIIAVFKTNTLQSQGEVFEYLKSNFSSTDDFLDYVYNVRMRSLINTPVDIRDDDKILTLSTCSSELKDFRTVVVARKIRKNESADVDVSKAKVNEKPLYPDYWYSVHGGEKPEITSFKEALSKGEIQWYAKTGVR